MLRALVAVVLPVTAWCQAETSERVFGPFPIGDRSFQASVSAASLRIQDADGVLHFEKKLPDQTKAHVARLAGKNGSGLLVTYQTPAAPRGRSWEVLGLKDGKLASFGLPVTPEGELEMEAGQDVAAAWDAALRVDVINFRIWTGNFFVLVPLEPGWERGNLRLAYGLVRNCRMAVEADRKPVEEESTVRLFQSADEESGKPAEIGVRRGSAVEILEAVGRVLWEESDEQILLGVAEDIWLKVRIDGKEGYLHSSEDFAVIGLPEAD
jgi:hypothetical protein